MTVLISKPGITRVAVSSGVPKDWSQSWFRDFASDYLKGADVRNAVGTGGLIITGNLTSPYATIGFKAPITLPGQVTITPPSTAIPSLVVQSQSGTGTAVQVVAGGATAISIQLIGKISGTHGWELVADAAGVAEQFGIFDDTAGFYRFLIDPNGVVAVQQTLQISGSAGLAAGYGSTIAIASNMTGANSRLFFGDGTGWTFNFTKRTGSVNTDLVLISDGGSGLGATLAVNATTGHAFLANGIANNFSAEFVSPNTAGQSFGPLILAGSGNASEDSFAINNAANTLNYFIVAGNGAVEFPNIGTTASAANAFLSGSSNVLLKSTSSLRYKANVASIQAADIDALLKMRPVTYTSLAVNDDPATVHLGFIAEEMALIDPRLVHWIPSVQEWTMVQRGTGRPVPHLMTGAGSVPIPDSVQYDRVTTLLVGAVQTLAQRVAALEAHIAAAGPAAPAAPLSLSSGYGLTGTNVVTTPPVLTVKSL